MAYVDMTTPWVVPRVGDWVLTKSKKVALFGLVTHDRKAFLSFLDGHHRSYDIGTLTVLEPEMQKLLNESNKQFIERWHRG
jgi:hypothetical protein